MPGLSSARSPSHRPRTLALRAALALALAFACFGTGASTNVPLPPHQRVWRQWTVDDGLPQITVSAIAKDRDGYLWLGTQDGLARFDGTAFRHYGTKQYPGLRHDMVYALAPDTRGSMWIGTVGGLARLRDGRIDAVPVPSPGTGTVFALQPDAGGGLWIASEHGLFRADAAGRVRAIGAGGQGSSGIVAVIAEPGHAVVAVRWDGLIVDPAGRADWRALPGVPQVLAARRGPDGLLWLGTVAGLYRVDAAGHPQGTPLLAGREIQSFDFDAERAAWVGTEHGLWRIPPDGTPERVTVPGIDADAWVLSVRAEPDGTVWVGSQLSGLHRAYAGRFRRLLARDGLVDGPVWTAYTAPNGEIWAGTPQGLFRGGITGFRQVADARTLPNATVLATLEDRAGTLWIGTYGGLARWPKGAARPTTEPSIGNATVSGLLQDDDGSVLVGASNGLYRIDGRNVAHVALPGANEGVLITGIARGANGRVWVGYGDGVAYRDEAGRWIRVRGTEAPALTTASLSPFDDGMLATGLETFFFVDPRGVHRLGTAQGLHVDVAHSVRATAHDVWYQAAHGIGRIPAAQLRELIAGRRQRLDVRVYGDLGDPEVAQCNGGQQDSATISEGRWLWCPGLQGLLALDLTRADLRSPPVATRIEAVTTSTRRLERWPAADALELQARERDLQIDFAGLDLREPERLRFLARLVGYDAAWKPLGDRRTAFYTNLPAGDYRFEVRARNGDGVLGPVAGLSFSIAPRWYERGLVQAAGVVALLLALRGAFRWRVAALHRRREVLEARVRQRTAELEEANRRLEASSLTDALTGLRNRRFLLGQMPHEIARVDRLHAASTDAPVLAVLHVDLDHFKAINDAHGHHVGDQVLRVAADLLLAGTRDADFAARWGGEEFLVVARDIARDDVSAWAQRMVRAFRDHPVATDAGELRVTCSIGYAVYPPVDGTSDWEQALQTADAATYLAKRRGRDRAVGIELLRTLDADALGTRLHREPEALAGEGWIRIDSPAP